jgi:hypothetical protein
MVGAGKGGSDLVLDVFRCGCYLLVYLTADAGCSEEELVSALVEVVIEDKERANDTMAAEEVEGLSRYP